MTSVEYKSELGPPKWGGLGKVGRLHKAVKNFPLVEVLDFVYVSHTK
jgi:hypothetical protein